MNTAVMDYRQRLLKALEQALAEKPYRDVTLSDITAAAKVSRRTFYEHFSNKDECLLALSEQTCQGILTLILASFSLDDVWEDVVTKVTMAYLTYINDHPDTMLALYTEVMTLGQAGMASRRKIAETFAELLRSQTHIRQARGEISRSIDSATGLALVAGINELILYRLLDKEKDDRPFQSLAPTAIGLVMRLTTDDDHQAGEKNA